MSLQPPYLAFAFFCERVLQEQDGVITPIRIVDRLLIHHLGITRSHKFPLKNPIQTIALVVGLKSGEYKGKGKITIEGKYPSGKPLSPKSLEADVELSGPDGGANLIFNLGLPYSEAGTYWFDIYFNKRLLTRTPLNVSVLLPPIPTAKLATKKRARLPRKV